MDQLQRTPSRDQQLRMAAQAVPSARRATRASVWKAGVLMGIRVIPREPVLGLKRLILPVSYWRAAEFAYVWNQIELPPGSRVLDLGSPKELALMMAPRTRFELVATDILPAAVALSERYARAQGLDGHGPGLIWSEVQDGRSLTYADDSFDAAFSVSVLEHIPERGDTAAIRELVRVVRPGGVVVVTTPFDRAYRESFVDHGVYERPQLGSEPVFFERHYDAAALVHRLVTPSGADLVDEQLWGETSVRMEALLDRLGRCRAVLSPFEPLLSIACLHRIGAGRNGQPMAVFLTLRKPSV